MNATLEKEMETKTDFLEKKVEELNLANANLQALYDGIVEASQQQLSKGNIGKIISTGEYDKRAKRIESFQKTFAQTSNLMDSLKSQIEVMEKAQASKKVKEGLASKKKALDTSRENCIKALKEIDSLWTQQMNDINLQYKQATAKLAEAQRSWLSFEEELTGAVSADSEVPGPQAGQDRRGKADIAFLSFSQARTHLQIIEQELKTTFHNISETRARIASLRDDPSGTDTTISAGNSDTANKSLPKKRTNQVGTRASKRQKSMKK
jgi:hypothetical protein